ncbi:Cilia- and flagella-associated protein 52 [Liparis tanakae]|uniref:Cilia- and flagella-associated protein 52 n=1 Tax=Liparis tanakae TaxID=230148 RepID=A0A4Z2GR58_9TELE|nr:Cilia- and flagella-associated protein 52 [Liparis tanakae]
MALETPTMPQLELEAVIGFNGHVCAGLRVHPDREHLIYPLGCAVILKRIKDGKQEFLHGHTNNVSCVSVSKSGLIVVWNIETKQAICGSLASAHSAGHCLTVQYSNTNDNVFVSAGSGTLRVWELDVPNRKIRPTECQIGKLKRIVKCVQITENDEFIFCGTTSGDILKINLQTGFLSDFGPDKEKFSMGVNVLRILKCGDLLVGSGSGTFVLCSKTKFKILKRAQLKKGVTSIAIRGEDQQFYVGTEGAQMYRFTYDDFRETLISTSHSSAVNDVAICL